MSSFFQRTIAISSNVVRLVGDPKAAIWYSQLIYWTRTGVDVLEHEGWIYKTRDEWEQETGLTRNEQESVRKHLVARVLLDEGRMGMPARLCYRVNLGALAQQVSSLIQQAAEESVQLSLLDFRENLSVVKTLLGHPLAFHRAWVEKFGLLNALFLSRLMQIDDWIRKSRSERDKDQAIWISVQTTKWKQETGLSAGQQRYATEALSAVGILELASVVIPRKKCFIRLNKTRLVEALNDAGFSIQDSVPAQQKSVCKNLPTGNAPKGEPDGGFLQSWSKHQYLLDLAGQNTTVCQSDIPGAAHQVGQIGELSTDFLDNHEADAENQRLVSADKSVGFEENHRLISANYTRTRIGIKDYKQQLQGALKTTAPKLSTPSDVVVVDSQKEQDSQDHLVWPASANLTFQQREAFRLKLQKLPQPFGQQVLDELQGNLAAGKEIRNPVGWLRTMIGLAEKGLFVPELADGIALARDRAQAQAQAAQKLGQPSSSTSDGDAVKRGVAPSPEVVARIEAVLRRKTKWSQQAAASADEAQVSDGPGCDVS